MKTYPHTIIHVHGPITNVAIQIPNLKIFVANEGAKPKAYCNAEAFTRRLGNSTAPLPGEWRRYTVDFGDLRCDYEGALPTQVGAHAGASGGLGSSVVALVWQAVGRSRSSDRALMVGFRRGLGAAAARLVLSVGLRITPPSLRLPSVNPARLAPTSQVDRIDFQNPAVDGSVSFCLADFGIMRAPPAAPQLPREQVLV